MYWNFERPRIGYEVTVIFLDVHYVIVSDSVVGRASGLIVAVRTAPVKYVILGELKIRSRDHPKLGADLQTGGPRGTIKVTQ